MDQKLNKPQKKATKFIKEYQMLKSTKIQKGTKI